MHEHAYNGTERRAGEERRKIQMDSPTQMLNKLVTDVYYGDGKDNPPIVTRLDRLEIAMADLKTIKLLLIGTILTVIITAVAAHFKFAF